MSGVRISKLKGILAMPISSADYARAADAIRAHARVQPRIGVVLGSGLGALADEVQDAVAIPYADIPGMPRSTVHGHVGEFVVGMLEGKPTLVQRGRVHFYEGYEMQQVTFAVRVMRALGVEIVVLTNAAGGINRAFSVGDVMVIEDHINFVGMAGHNPLVGPNDDSLGTRFPGMGNAYDRDLRKLATRVADAQGIGVQRGVYCAVAGPNFESPAEIRALRALGADAVGMSTVHEVIAARHGGMRALAFSGITNVCIDQVDAETDANHEEVLEAGKVIVPKLRMLIKGVLREVVL
jgi:purine-nucleoside phosphorylase